MQRDQANDLAIGLIKHHHQVRFQFNQRHLQARHGLIPKTGGGGNLDRGTLAGDGRLDFFTRQNPD